MELFEVWEIIAIRRKFNDWFTQCVELLFLLMSNRTFILYATVSSWYWSLLLLHKQTILFFQYLKSRRNLRHSYALSKKKLSKILVWMCLFAFVFKFFFVAKYALSICFNCYLYLYSLLFFVLFFIAYRTREQFYCIAICSAVAVNPDPPQTQESRDRRKNWFIRIGLQNATRILSIVCFCMCALLYVFKPVYLLYIFKHV